MASDYADGLNLWAVALLRLEHWRWTWIQTFL